MQRKIQEELLADYSQIINGLCTPDEFVNVVMEDIIANTAQYINLDYHDVTCVLRNASAADAVCLQGNKTEMRQMLDAGLEKLNAAHPQKKVCTIMVQIQAPTEDLVMDDINVFNEFFAQFDDIDIKWGMANRGNPGDAIQVTMIVGFK